MGTFDDVPIEWEGKTYKIPAHRVLGAIARIEDVVTLQELVQYGQRGVAPFGKIAMAYAAVLRYAGATITDDEVYDGMLRSGKASDRAMDGCNGLMTMMLPRDLQKEMAVSDAEEPPPGNASPIAAASSRKPTKRRSERSASQETSSGQCRQ